MSAAPPSTGKKKKARKKGPPPRYEVAADKSIFGDPLPGVEKALFVQMTDGTVQQAVERTPQRVFVVGGAVKRAWFGDKKKPWSDTRGIDVTAKLRQLTGKKKGSGGKQSAQSQAAHTVAVAAEVKRVVDDLIARFLLNLPDEELGTVERLFYHLEQAWWYYEDMMADNNPSLPHYDFYDFGRVIFAGSALLAPHRGRYDELYEIFQQYLAKIPVYGAILLNDAMTRCIAVKSYKGTSWTFPRGKINEDEAEADCAAREVLEEVGYDCRKQIVPTDFKETVVQEKREKLFFVRGVPDDFHFVTKTRKEIGAIEWHDVASLPKSSKDDGYDKKFWRLLPYINPLRAYIKRQRKADRAAGRKVAATPGGAGAAGGNGAGGGGGRSERSERSRPTPRTANAAGDYDDDERQDYDDDETFGDGLGGGQGAGWSAADMFATNERMLGRKIEFDAAMYGAGSRDSGGPQKEEDDEEEKEKDGGIFLTGPIFGPPFAFDQTAVLQALAGVPAATRGGGGGGGGSGGGGNGGGRGGGAKGTPSGAKSGGGGRGAGDRSSSRRKGGRKGGDKGGGGDNRKKRGGASGGGRGGGKVTKGGAGGGAAVAAGAVVVLKRPPQQ